MNMKQSEQSTNLAAYAIRYKKMLIASYLYVTYKYYIHILIILLYIVTIL